MHKIPLMKQLFNIELMKELHCLKVKRKGVVDQESINRFKNTLESFRNEIMGLVNKFFSFSNQFQIDWKLDLRVNEIYTDS